MASSAVAAPAANALTCSDVAMIPLYVGIGAFGLTNLYHTRVATSFVGTYKDKVYFYLTHCISVMPMMLYIFKVLEVAFTPVLKSNAFFSFFFMEWVSATTLMLLSLGRLGKMPLSTYMKLAHADAAMLVGGHISMMSETSVGIYVPYGISCLCFVYILMGILGNYRASKQVRAKITQPKQAVAASVVWQKVHTILTLLTMGSWFLYPVNQILYKTDVISFGTTLLVIVVLDILSKLVFVNVLIGTHLVYRGDTSVLAMMSRRMIKIHALDVVITEEIDSHMQHQVSLTLDMRRADGASEKTVTHVTHVSEMEGLEGVP